MRFGARWTLDRFSNSESDSKFAYALHSFSRDAVVYCDGLSDASERSYAMEYLAMLQDRLQGIHRSFPQLPFTPFKPNGNVIQATLERMLQDHFPAKTSGGEVGSPEM